MKKKFIALIYLLILICTCSIGFATWVFTNDHFFGANYAPQAEFNFNDQKATYDGQVHEIAFPTNDNNALKTLVNTNYQAPIITKVGDSNVSELKTAGSYDIQLLPLDTKVNEFEPINIKYTIDKRALGLTYGIKENIEGGQVLPSTTGKDMVYEFEKSSMTYLPEIGLTNVIQGDSCTLTFKETIGELIIPTTKKTYTITGCSNPNYSLPIDNTFSITIKKLKTHLEVINNEISINFDPTNTQLTWDAFQTKIDNLIQFKVKGDTTNTPVENAVSLGYDLMHNGDIYYGTSRPKGSRTSRIVAGSTYLLTFHDMNSANSDYVIDTNSIIVKYKTAKIESNYYTIEDALNTGGTIVLAGDSTGKNTYISTSFTKINTTTKEIENFTHSLKGTSKLYIPYTDDANEQLKSISSTFTLGNSNVHSVLVIPKGIQLNMDSGSNMYVCGAMAGNMPNPGNVGQRGVVINDGLINMNAANIDAIGFIKGIGEIKCFNGSNINDVFRMYDFPGGSNAFGMNGKIFPINVYTFHSASCKLIIDGKSNFITNYRVDASNEFEGKIAILGKNGKQLGLFTLKNPDDYMVKRCESIFIKNGEIENNRLNEINVNDNFDSFVVSTNQSSEQREIIELYGDFNDNKLDVKLRFLAFTASLSTSKEVAMPIGYMKIHIKSNNGKPTTGTLSNNSYKFFPGSELIIDKNTTLVVDSGVNIVAIDENYKEDFIHTNGSSVKVGIESELSYQYNHPNWYKLKDELRGANIVNNGTITVNGAIGGKIKTEVEGAQLNVANSTATIKVLSSIKFVKLNSNVNTKSFSDKLRLRIYDGKAFGEKFQSVPKGNYLSKSIKNSAGEIIDAGWFVNGSSSIEYETFTNEVINPKTITITSTGYSITQNDLPTNLNRPHYTFDGWYLSKSYNDDEKVTEGMIIYSGTVLYAKWNPINYKINYVYKDDMGNILNESFINNNIGTFNIETNIGLEIPTDSNGLVFGGWYINDEKINVVDGEVRVNDLDANKTLTISGVWWPKNTKQVTISFNANNNEYNPDSYAHQDKAIYDESFIYKLDSLSENDNDVQKTKYFIGWKLVGRPDSEIITELNYNHITNDKVDLIAVWGEKTTIQFNSSVNPNVKISLYVKPGQSTPIPEISKGLLNQDKVNSGLFAGFLVDSGPLKDQLLQIGSSYTLSNTPGGIIVLKDVYKAIISIADPLDAYVIVTYPDPANPKNDITLSCPGDVTDDKFVVDYGTVIKILIYDKKNLSTNNTKVQIFYPDGKSESFDNKSVIGGAYREIVVNYKVTGDISIILSKR